MVADSFVLTALFQTPLGRLMYYLLTLVCLEAGWGMCYNEWRKRGSREYRNIVLALSVLLISRALALITDLMGAGAGNGLMGASQTLLDMIALVLLCWAFQFSVGDATSWRLYLSVNLVGIGLLYLLHAFSAGLWRGAVPLALWQERVWLLWQSVLCALAAALILRRRHPETVLQGLAFVLLAVGRLGPAFLPAAGLRPLSDLIAFPLLLISLYQDITGQLHSLAQEFQAISEPASRQMRQLMFSLESARMTAGDLDLRSLLPRLTESVTLALSADHSAIFVAEEAEEKLGWDASPSPDGPIVLRLGSVYDPLQPALPPGRTLALGEAPIFTHILETRQLAHLKPAGDGAALASLALLLRKPQVGDVLVQPLVMFNNVMGILVAAHQPGRPAFDEADERLCEGMASPIAAALSNARMVQSLKLQARQLANLLEVQQIENSKTRAMLESIADGVIVCDAARQIMLTNQAAARLLGVAREALLEENMAQLQRRLGCELRSDSAGALLAFQSDPLGAEGRVLRGSVAPVGSDDGRRIGSVIVFRDVTNELRAEQAKREFLATVSHELRTPLTSIKGYSELMAGGMAGDLPAPLKRFLRMIAGNADKMAHLVDNILYVSEAERGSIPLNRRPADILELIQDAVNLAAPAFAERNITVEVKVESDMPAMDVDPARLRQVLDNLLQNAWKYTPAGGRVWVSARAYAGDELLTDNASDREQDYLLIAVRDTGVGIKPEDQQRIFERFYRSPNPLSLEAGGTGIGLTIVKSLVEAHGGRVWVDSAENAGSTFSILLPVTCNRPVLALASRAA
jgi:PAS domain S-box-containing protein